MISIHSITEHFAQLHMILHNMKNVFLAYSTCITYYVFHIEFNWIYLSSFFVLKINFYAPQQRRSWRETFLSQIKICILFFFYYYYLATKKLNASNFLRYFLISTSRPRHSIVFTPETLIST